MRKKGKVIPNPFEENYPLLTNLFLGYFNQDWPDFYDSDQDVVTDFATLDGSATREQCLTRVEATKREIERFLREAHPDGFKSALARLTESHFGDQTEEQVRDFLKSYATMLDVALATER